MARSLVDDEDGAVGCIHVHKSLTCHASVATDDFAVLAVDPDARSNGFGTRAEISDAKLLLPDPAPGIEHEVERNLDLARAAQSVDSGDVFSDATEARLHQVG